MSLRWHPQKRRYVRDDGSTVSSREVRSWVDEMSVAFALYLMSYALGVTDAQGANDEELQALREWATAMRSNLAELHRASTIVAAGGVAQMTEEFWDFADSQTAFHRSFLDSFIAGAMYGVIVLDGTFVARSALYASAGYSTYESAVALREQRAGVPLYRRRLMRGVEHCEKCVSHAAQGYRPIGTLPNIAQECDCRVNCRCYFQFTSDMSLLGSTA